MSTKTVLASALLMILIGSGAVRAQGYAPSTAADTAPDDSAPATLSSWITYSEHDCCGPTGGCGPIGIELYVRTGPALMVAGGWLGDSLNPGWLVQAGGRSLFFNAGQSAAWTADLGLCHIYNNGNRPDLSILNANIPRTSFTVRTLERTYATLAVGRERWLGGPASDCGPRLRVGWDFGGRFGAARLDTNTLSNLGVPGYHRFGSEAGAVFGGVQSVLEIPRGCCIWHAGIRAEIDDSWTDFDGLENKSIWDMNFLLSLGVRY